MGTGKRPVDYGMAEALAFAPPRESRARPCASADRTRSAAPSTSATPSSSTSRTRTIRPARKHRRRTGALRDLQLHALRSRRARLRIRLQPRLSRVARPLGSSVRRLRQWRANHHRPVHQRRRSQVEPALRPRACCCRTATKARARNIPAPASSASSSSPPSTTSRSPALERRAVLPSAAPPGPARTGASRSSSSRRRACCAIPTRSSPIEDFAHKNFLNVIPDTTVGEADRILICTGKIGHELQAERNRRNDTSTAIVFLEQLYPLPEAGSRRRFDRHGNTPTSSGCRKSRPTWARMFNMLPAPEAHRRRPPRA